jgi:hypothetical protein
MRTTIPSSPTQWPQRWKTPQDCDCDSCRRMASALKEHTDAVAHVRATRAALERISRAVDARHHLNDRAQER